MLKTFHYQCLTVRQGTVHRAFVHYSALFLCTFSIFQCVTKYVFNFCTFSSLFSIMLAFLMLSTFRGTLSPCYIFVMLRFCHVVLFSCCILPCCSFFVLRFFQAALISCYILSLFYFCIHAALFLSCVLFTWRISLLAHNSYFIFLYVVLFQTALFSCLHSFHVAVFEVASCCICFHQGRLNKKEI